jgi:ankyrin repeat protein
MARFLYDNGANVNELDSEGNSCVHMLVTIGNLRWLKFLIKNFDINCFQRNNKGNTPFMVACLNGRLEIVEYFISKIPNLNWKNKNGQTALHAAIFSNQLDVIKLLLEYKADITVKDIVRVILIN